MDTSTMKSAKVAASPIVSKKVKQKNTVKTGNFDGKSNALGQGGRAAQLKAKGVPAAVIGAIARSKGAAPGGKNYK